MTIKPINWFHGMMGGDNPIATFDFETNTWKGNNPGFISKEQHYSHGIIKDNQNK
jgi:hypothetical protein